MKIVELLRKGRGRHREERGLGASRWVKERGGKNRGRERGVFHTRRFREKLNPMLASPRKEKKAVVAGGASIFSLWREAPKKIGFFLPAKNSESREGGGGGGDAEPPEE